MLYKEEIKKHNYSKIPLTQTPPGAKKCLFYVCVYRTLRFYFLLFHGMYINSLTLDTQMASEDEAKEENYIFVG